MQWPCLSQDLWWSAVSTVAHHCFTGRRSSTFGSRLVVVVGGGGADRLALSGGQARQLSAWHSYERWVTLNTTMCLTVNTCGCLWNTGQVWRHSAGVENDRSALRVQDSGPSYQQQDRQTTWQWGRGSGRQLVPPVLDRAAKHKAYRW